MMATATRAGRLRTAQRDSRRAGARDAGGIAAALRPSDGWHGHRRTSDLRRPQPERVGRAVAVEGAAGVRAGGGIAWRWRPEGTVNLSGRVSRMQATGSGDWVHRKPMPQISAQIRNFWVLEALCSAAVTRSRRRGKRFFI